MGLPRRASSKGFSSPTNQSMGILDDHGVRKNLATQEGSIERTPTNDNHITNKKYVDDRDTIILGSATDYTDSLHPVLLNEVANPEASKVFNLGNNKSLTWTSVDRTPVADEGIFNWECQGNFTGDLCHMHQHTGNAGVGTVLLKIEYADTDITPIEILNGVPSSIFKVDNNGNLTLAGTVDGIDIATDVAANTTASHARQHSITSTDDHTGIATQFKMLMADANGLPVEAENTNTEVNLAVVKTHTESHNISSHSDTTAIGTELNTLTDDSMANALHRHSELAGGNGVVDPALEIDNAGILTISAQSRMSAGRATAQSIPNNTNTTVLFTTEYFDTQGEYVSATGIFTATVAGYYAVSWGVFMDSAAYTIGELFQTNLSKNNSGAHGSNWMGSRWVAAGNQTINARSIGSAIVYLAATDTLRVWAKHTQGAAVNTLGGTAYNYFMVHKLS